MPTASRRSLLLSALMTATWPLASVVAQNPEDAVYLIDLPSKTTVWGAVMLFSNDFVEVMIATAKGERRVRGRFKGQQLAEHSWKNDSSQPQRVAISARAIGTNRELPHRNVRYTAGESLIIGFGNRPCRPTPATAKGPTRMRPCSSGSSCSMVIDRANPS
jgi:hypothetical protein